MNDAAQKFIEKSRKSAIGIGSLRQLVVSIANEAVKSRRHTPDALVKIGDHCRQVGAHEEAARVFGFILEIDPNFPKAKTCQAVLSGESLIDLDLTEGPAPFVHLKDFLGDDLHKAIMRRLVDDIDHFNDATVYNSKGDKSIDPNSRRGKVLHDKLIGPYRQLFLPQLELALKTRPILASLGISEISGMRFEIQATNYSEGEFFGRHVDSNTGRLSHRKVSYVYYTRRMNDCFFGGDLIIYDKHLKSSKHKQPSYTRISPEDNSIVFFLSDSPHEVLPTFVNSGNRLDGRFSINGWLVDGYARTED